MSSPVYFAVFKVTDHLDGWLHGRSVSLALVMVLAMNFHHYLVDAVIWKRSAS